MLTQELRGNTFATSSGVLTATGAETVHDTTVTITFCINGKAYTKTAITDGATPTTDHNTGAAFTAIPIGGGYGYALVWALNASGTMKLMQGALSAWDGTSFDPPPAFPTIPDDVCPIAYQLIKGGSTVAAAWLPGTGNWNATGITSDVPDNVLVLPSRPQTS